MQGDPSQGTLPFPLPPRAESVAGAGQLEFSLLSSGSRANCIYVASRTTGILIDCGLSARETAKRLAQIGRRLEDIHAVIITHEHSDHVRGLSSILKRRNVPVWLNRGTQEGTSAILDSIEGHAAEIFCSETAFCLGDLEITPFRVSHDANDPVMFRFASGNCAIALATDLGHVTASVELGLRDVDAVIIETNHDRERLLNGPYPWYLKRRILGERGHLSNEDAGKFLAALACHQYGDSARRELQVVVGAHVSEQNNTTELVYEALIKGWKLAAVGYDPEYLVADAFQPTPLVSFVSDGVSPARRESSAFECAEARVPQVR